VAACVVARAYWGANQQPGNWQIMAQWIDDNLSYSSLFFFPTQWAVNINWHERPLRLVDSYAEPEGRWVQSMS
jgi:hypothetical protein